MFRRLMLGIIFIIIPFALCTARDGDALFILDTTTASPGQSELIVTLTISPGGLPIVSWSAVIAYDPSILQLTNATTARPSDYFEYLPPETFKEQGRAGVGGRFSMRDIEEQFLWEPGPVATLHFCVLATSPAGSYPIEFRPDVEGRPFVGPTIYSTYCTASDLNAFIPQTQSGAISISGPAIEGECHQEPWDYVPPPADIEVSYALNGPDTVATQESFTVEWMITTNVDLGTCRAAIDFDEAFLAPPEVSINDECLGPRNWILISVENDVLIEVVADFTGAKWLKPGTQRVATLHFTARNTQVATRVAFADAVERTEVDRDGNVSVVTHRNMVGTITQEAVAPFIEPVIMKNLPLKIDDFRFQRGDANNDSKVNLSDAVRILGYLFLGAKAPECPDAADADDSGDLSITDPICLLGFLFKGGSDLPDPGAYKNGVDPTADSLSCGE